MTDTTPDPDPKVLAEQLSSLLGREQGAALLERIRSMVILSPRPGLQTTEFKLSLVACVAGLALVVYGGYLGNETLGEHGVALIQYAVAGYAVSRGIAKTAK